MMKSRWNSPFLITAVALMLRLLWIALVPIEPVSDGVLYDAFARNIASGNGYVFADGTPTEYWPVGTAAVYAVLYHTFGMHLTVIAVFQALLGTLIVAQTWQIARRAFDCNVAAVAAWFTALWPLLIEFTTIFASELLFIALILTTLNVWSCSRIPFSTRMVCWGACIAFATYVRPTAGPLLFAMPILLGFFDRNWRVALKTLAIASLTASMLFAPWTYRSMKLFDRFVLVSANGGVNLWMGNNPDSTGGYMELPNRQFANEVDRDRYYGKQATAFIRSHPLEYARLSINRLATTYSRETIGAVWNEMALTSRYGTTLLNALKIISSMYWWSMLLLGGIGIVMAVAAGYFRRLWHLLAVFGYLAIFPILTVSMDRYHVPIDPMLAIFAAFGIFALFRRFPPKHQEEIGSVKAFG